MSYSIKSFNSIDAWLKELKSNSNPDVKIFLIGNKVDDEEHRIIKYKDAKNFAKQYILIFNDFL